MKKRNHWSVTVLLAAFVLIVAAALFLDPKQAIAKDDIDDPFPVLRPGATMTGIYVMGGTVAATTRTVGYIDAQINFPRRVQDHAKYQVEVIRQGSPGSVNCPGARRAAPGFLCIYEVYKDHRLTLGDVYNPIGTGGKLDRDGVALWGAVESADSDDGDSPFSAGGWAITGRDRRE
jgi:hypothetical protein